MDSSIKISLTMQVPGRTRHFVRMLRNKVTLQDTSLRKLSPAMANRIIGSAKIPLYEYVPAQHHINMSRDAYNYMISNEPPAFFQPYQKLPIRIKAWKKLKPEEKIGLHMEQTAQHFGAISYTYSIIEEDDCTNWRIPW